MPNVPEVLLRRLFVPGSLRRYPDGFSFQMNNTLASVTLTGFRLEVDGQKIASASLSIQAGEQQSRTAGMLSHEQPFLLQLNIPVTLRVQSSNLRPRKLTISAETLEAGTLRFSVDPNPQRQAQKPPGFLRNIGYSWRNRLRTARVKRDPHHPIFHFTPPANWVNDPNGLIAWRGRTHLFYQHNPLAPAWGSMNWGHAVSDDLAHWRRLPIALSPSPDGPDRDGCWSGCAVNDNGTPTFLYTAVFPESVCLARGSRDLLTWQKHSGNPVISAPPPGLEVEGFRDPYVWQDGDMWYMALGSGLRAQGGCILLYRSADLVNWEYLQPALTGDVNSKEPLWTGTMWECPQLFPLGDDTFLIFSVCHASQLYYTAVFRGDFAEGKFVPRTLSKFDYGNSAFYAPQTYLDDKGRRVMFGWVAEERSDAALKKVGWAGAISLPRVLSLGEQGELYIEPTPELAALRGQHVAATGVWLGETPTCLAPELGILHLELRVQLEAPQNGRVTFLFACSPQAEEQTVLYYDVAKGILAVDTTRASLNPNARGSLKECPLPRQPGEKLQLHIFIDGSILEVFANRTMVLTTRMYPTRTAGMHLFAFAEGRVYLENLDGWQMKGCLAEG